MAILPILPGSSAPASFVQRIVPTDVFPRRNNGARAPDAAQCAERVASCRGCAPAGPPLPPSLAPATSGRCHAEPRHVAQGLFDAVKAAKPAAHRPGMLRRRAPSAPRPAGPARPAHRAPRPLQQPRRPDFVRRGNSFGQRKAIGEIGQVGWRCPSSPAWVVPLNDRATATSSASTRSPGDTRVPNASRGVGRAPVHSAARMRRDRAACAS